MITPVINAKIILNVYPALTIPNAVAQAGGCSISVIAIKNIEVPTVNEKIIIETIEDETGINANSIPTDVPIMCPPMTFLPLAIKFVGVMKTINVVAPKEATITAFCILINRIAIKIDSVAIVI